MSPAPNWPKEHIPDEDQVYRRAHSNFCLPDGTPGPGIIEKKKPNSVDWSKYSTPEESHKRATEPQKNAVVGFIAGEVRKMQSLTVEHTPEPIENNRAHSEINGVKDSEMRLKLLRICRLIIPLP